MINVILDNSGSMQENGKSDALIYIAKCLQDYCVQNGFDISFFDISNKKIIELEKLEFDNYGILLEQKENSILLSDGYLDINDIKFDIFIGIGADAIFMNVKKKYDILIKPENAIYAIDFFKYFKNESSKITQDSKDENDDEW